MLESRHASLWLLSLGFCKHLQIQFVCEIPRPITTEPFCKYETWISIYYLNGKIGDFPIQISPRVDSLDFLDLYYYYLFFCQIWIWIQWILLIRTRKIQKKPHMIYLQQNLLIKLLHIQIPLSPPSVSVYSLPVPHPLSSSSGQSVSWLPISPCLFLSPLQIASGGDLSLGWTFPEHRWIETEGLSIYRMWHHAYSKVK